MTDKNKPEGMVEVKLEDLENQYKDLMLKEYQAEEALRDIRKSKNHLAQTILQITKELQNRLAAFEKAFPAGAPDLDGKPEPKEKQPAPSSP